MKKKMRYGQEDFITNALVIGFCLASLAGLWLLSK